ncbi:hypothetical protein BUALT_Bualt09G0109300 [Buddleja alternifolia]|uniref:Arf-GAP domain-containing protein n=1 Tax=Buddleja alternifolia TaxID=168488 RepID=A0AAV6X321_9LAMI|nr:hypothetical protein BUALT_Bualt09G0109300 [Buddleja alternifolia]
MCLECSGKHRGLGVHISFVRSVTMDSWSEIQIKKMELGGNEKFNNFIAQYGIPKDTEIVAKYNTNAASIYRDRIQALAEGKPWRDPTVVKETLKSNNNVGNSYGSKPPLSSGGGRNGNSMSSAGWDSWDGDGGYSGNGSGNNVRRNSSLGDFRSSSNGGSAPSRSKSTENLYSRSELEVSAANKESFFARKMVENETRPEGLPPSQGGKYVGLDQGFGRLSMVAASAASVVQAGTKEFTSKVKEGGYDHKVNETVSVVSAKTSEIGQKTWGLMKGVMALASQKAWNSSGSQPSSNKQFNSVSSGSWDDWDTKDSKKEESSKTKTSQDADSWAGWDDGNDDGLIIYTIVHPIIIPRVIMENQMATGLGEGFFEYITVTSPAKAAETATRLPPLCISTASVCNGFEVKYSCERYQILNLEIACIVNFYDC